MTIEEQKKFVEMQEDISTVRSDVKEIKAALLGDGYLSQGLVGELKEQKDIIRKQDERISKLEGMIKKVTWLALGAGAGGILGLKWLADFVMRLLSSSGQQ